MNISQKRRYLYPNPKSNINCHATAVPSTYIHPISFTTIKHNLYTQLPQKARQNIEKASPTLIRQRRPKTYYFTRLYTLSCCLTAAHYLFKLQIISSTQNTQQLNIKSNNVINNYLERHKNHKNVCTIVDKIILNNTY